MMASAARTCSRDTVESWLWSTARAEGIPLVAIEWTVKSSGRTSRAGGGYRIELNPELLGHPDVIGHIAAHELGHAAAGDLPHFPLLAPVLGGLIAGVSGTYLAMCAARAALPPDAGLAVLATGMGAALVSISLGALAVQYVLARRDRSHEIAADTWAAQHGHPLTREALDYWTTKNPKPSRWPSHPSWPDRFRNPENLAALAQVQGLTSPHREKVVPPTRK